MNRLTRLAALRTALANERTLLAYVRTALTLCVAGVSLIQLFDSPPLVTLGWMLLLLSLAAAGLGAGRFLAMAKALRREGKWRK